VTLWSRLFGPRGGPTGYGYSPGEPIPCDGETGEREFLDSLRCPNGHAFRHRRVASVPGRCPLPSGHRPEGECIVDKFALECQEGEHSTALYFDMYHPGLPMGRAPAKLCFAQGKGPKPLTLTLQFDEGRPAWKISAVQPSRFRDVNYEVTVRVFRLPQGALLGVLLNLYDVPDQPYFLHRVMDLSDPTVERYVLAAIEHGRLVAVFEPKGEDEGFRREFSLEPRRWEQCLREGREHNRSVQVDGGRALERFLEVFNPASREKGVERAWDDVQQKLGC
jgi:hypothetical protein